jgi:uncharacterized protein
VCADFVAEPGDDRDLLARRAAGANREFLRACGESGDYEVVDQNKARLPASVAGSTATEAVAAVQAEQRVLQEIVRRLVAALSPERIYLFGSRARGDATEDSDYDVCVLVGERIGPGHSMEHQAYIALSDLGKPVEVVVMTVTEFDWLREAAASLAASVTREGRVLYAA